MRNALFHSVSALAFLAMTGVALAGGNNANIQQTSDVSNSGATVTQYGQAGNAKINQGVYGEVKEGSSSSITQSGIGGIAQTDQNYVDGSHQTVNQTDGGSAYADQWNTTDSSQSITQNQGGYAYAYQYSAGNSSQSITQNQGGTASAYQNSVGNSSQSITQNQGGYAYAYQNSVGNSSQSITQNQGGYAQASQYSVDNSSQSIRQTGNSVADAYESRATTSMLPLFRTAAGTMHFSIKAIALMPRCLPSMATPPALGGASSSTAAPTLPISNRSASAAVPASTSPVT